MDSPEPKLLESSFSSTSHHERPDVNTNITSKALDFFSHASESTLAACIVGLSAVIYMVFGRVGLLFIGMLFGISLHALWDKNYAAQDATSDGRRRQEASVDVAKRLLEWQALRGNSNAELKDSGIKIEIALKLAAKQTLDFSSFPSSVSAALSELVDAIIRDYVLYWYEPIIRDSFFPQASRQTLIGFLLSLSDHQARKRPADVFLNFLTNATSVLIVFLSELSQALMIGDGIELEIHEALSSYLNREKNSNLANIVNEEEQEAKLLSIADDVLQSFLDHKVYNCEPAKVFLVKTLSGIVLESVLKTISKPEWINSWIVYLLEDGEPELLNAIDVGVEHATQKNVFSESSARETDELPEASLKTFTRQEVKKMSTTSPSKHSDGSADAMQAAMEEAKRLTEMIRAEEALKSADMAPPSETQLPIDRGSDSHVSAHDVPTEDREISEPSSSGFTSFDQITPSYRAVPETPREVPPLTLHHAKITLVDDATLSEKVTIKNRPQIEYLLQIEPASSLHSGWMVARSSQEFEPLHEYLYKIANVTGANTFTRRYQYIPSYKGMIRNEYCLALQQYLCDALTYESLAESEGMKKFLDKDQGFRKSNGNKGALGFAVPVGDAFQTVGKGVLGGFSSATKGVAAGSQAVFEGVGGLFNAPRKQANFSKVLSSTSSHGNLDRLQDLSSSVKIPTHGLYPETKQSFEIKNSSDVHITVSSSSRTRDVEETAPAQSLDVHEIRASSRYNDGTLVSDGLGRSPTNTDIEALSQFASSETDTDRVNEFTEAIPAEAPQDRLHTLTNEFTSLKQEVDDNDHISRSSALTAALPLDESETRVAIELVFAAITELYTLSSAWNIRRTLLNAAKNYLLRPGNPSLLSIKKTLQSTILDKNFSSEAIAGHILKLRQNALPTEKEMQEWPQNATAEEVVAMRLKARRLLVAKGMPQTLSSVMGAAASGEALGRVFDALQVEKVNRGLMFAILMQGMKVVIQ